MNQSLDKYAPIILRLAMALVFLWFGISQITAVSDWTGWVPEFIANIIPAATVVTINGIVEVILGVLLLAGIGTRIVALLLGLHLFGIAAMMGEFSATAVRDFGLALATLSIFFNEPDDWCLERKWKKG